MILDDERLHELRSAHLSPQARPLAEITTRAHQLRRRRRATRVAAVTAAVALTWPAVTWSLPGPAPAPAAGPGPGAPPWPVPTAPYHALYEDVRVSFPGGPDTCGKDHAVDLRDPAGGPPAAGDAVLTVRPGCDPPTGTTVTVAAPQAGVSGGTGQRSIAPRITADQCLYGMRRVALAGGEVVLAPDPDGPDAVERVGAPMGRPVPGVELSELQNATMCVLAAPDPSRDQPLAMVRVELVLRDDGGVDATFTAWRGGPPVLVWPVETRR
jgi:hypothetical protein